MNEQDELKGALRRRVLAAVRRTPGVTVNQLTLIMSGADRSLVNRILSELEERGFVERKGSPSLWYTVEYITGPKPEPRTATFIPYKPPAMEVARPDALAHELAPSRRGNELVKHARPLGMCVGTLNDHRDHSAVTLRKDSPINGPTFCKANPMPGKPAPLAPKKRVPQAPINAPKKGPIRYAAVA
jgi:hypothetical protein